MTQEPTYINPSDVKPGDVIFLRTGGSYWVAETRRHPSWPGVLITCGRIFGYPTETAYMTRPRSRYVPDGAPVCLEERGVLATTFSTAFTGQVPWRAAASAVSCTQAPEVL